MTLRKNLTHIIISSFVISGIAIAATDLTKPQAPSIELLSELPEPASKTTELPKAAESENQSFEVSAASDDLRTRLLNSKDRIGFGAAATGGTNYVYVTNFEELKSALETDGNYVVLDPSLAGGELGFKDYISPANNITLDGSLAPGLVMYPDHDAGFTPSRPMINNAGNQGGEGNKIFHSFKLEGRREYPYDKKSRTGNVGGLFIREGKHYWVDHVEVTDFWDDAFISGFRTERSGEYITLSNVKIHNTDKAYQAFNMEEIQEGKGHITIFNSWFGAKGRNPNNRGAENFHFFNNYVNDWSWAAIMSGGLGLIGTGHATGSRTRDSVMLSESNVFESPTAKNNCAEIADPTTNYGGWVYTDGRSIYNGHDKCGNPNHVEPHESAGPGHPEIPYKYTLMPAEDVKAYVELNAGPLKY